MTTPFRPIHPGDEERVAAEMGRELEELGDVPGLHALPGFTDRVMAAIADEPVPQPAIALRVALRRGRLGQALAAMGDAWRVAFGGPRPFAVRAQALALVLVLAIVTLGAGGAAVVGASRLLGLDGPRPSAVEPSPIVSPPPSLRPSPSPSPSISPSPSLGPTPTPTENEPTETPEGSDDHGGGGGPGSGSGSGSGPGSGSGNSGSGSDSSGSGSSGSGSGSG
jgi:hypothetical protein